MLHEFSVDMLNDDNLSINYNSPYIFNLMDKKCRLVGINDDIFIPPGANFSYTPATFRAFPALIERELFLKKTRLAHMLLKKP